MDDLIGTNEAQKILDVHRMTITRWVAEGKLVPAKKLPGKNGAFLFKREDVLALVPEPETAA